MINNKSWCNLLVHKQDRDNNNSNLLSVIPGYLTSALHELFAIGRVLTAVYAMLANEVVYQTLQLNNCYICNMKSMCLGEDGMPHKLHISVDDVANSTIIGQGSVTKCTTLQPLYIVSVHSQVIIATFYHK